MTVYLVPNAGNPIAIDVAVQAAGVLAEAGAKLVADPVFRDRFIDSQPTFLPPEKAYEACNAVVTVGGDGTVLHTARRAMKFDKPLLGINAGRLGFLTAVEDDELEKLRRFVAGQYQIDRRSVLCFSYEGMQSDESEANLALNDIVMFKQTPEKVISLDIYCDDTKVSSFRGDGVIFATPTGSTAYSMSAGGPIVDAQMDGIVVTQICAHIVQTPPMVFAGGRVLKVVSVGKENERVLASADGMKGCLLPQGRPVTIQKADCTVPFIQMDDAGQLKAIDKKMKGR